MSYLDVTLASFWQLARHWQQGEAAKLEMSIEAGSLNIQRMPKLKHPDPLHFNHPSAPPCKRKPLHNSDSKGAGITGSRVTTILLKKGIFSY